MAELKIKVQRTGDIRSQNAPMTSTSDIGDSMVRNWATLEDQKVNPTRYGTEHFPFTPEQERLAAKAFADAFPASEYPMPEGRDIGDYLFIGNQSLSELYAQHGDAYDKLYPSKTSFMELTVYAEALKRDQAISFVNPQAITDTATLSHDAIMTVNPEVSDVTQRGFFGAVWNRVKNFLGMAGTETDMNNSYKTLHKNTEVSERNQRIANKFSLSNIMGTDKVRQQTTEDQAERDEVQKTFINHVRSYEVSLCNKDFFGDLTDDDFLENSQGQKTSLDNSLRRNSTRVNAVRLYMCAKGYSVEDIFSQDQKMAEARRAVGQEFMEKYHSKDPKVHAEMCAEMFNTLLDENIYPQLDLTNDRSLADNYQKMQFVNYSFVLFSEIKMDKTFAEAIKQNLAAGKLDQIQAKSDSFMAVNFSLTDRYRLIRSDAYANANDALKNDFYKSEHKNAEAPSLDKLKATNQILGEYQQRLDKGQNISQIVTDRAPDHQHKNEIYALAQHELEVLPPAEQARDARELLKPRERDVAVNLRVDVSNQFNSPQFVKPTENQKAQRSPQKVRPMQPM